MQLMILFVCHSLFHSCDHSERACFFCLRCTYHTTAIQKLKRVCAGPGQKSQPNDCDTMTFQTYNVEIFIEPEYIWKKITVLLHLFLFLVLLSSSSNNGSTEFTCTHTHTNTFMHKFHQIFVNANKLNCCLWKWIREKEKMSRGKRKMNINTLVGCVSNGHTQWMKWRERERKNTSFIWRETVWSIWK